MVASSPHDHHAVLQGSGLRVKGLQSCRECSNWSQCPAHINGSVSGPARCMLSTRRQRVPVSRSEQWVTGSRPHREDL